MDDDEKLVDQITGDFDEGYYGNYGFLGQYHEPTEGASFKKDVACSTPKKCVRKGDVICYIKNENIKTVTAGEPRQSSNVESMGSESNKSRSSTDTTDQSGESLYKTFIFEESVNENDTQKCIAFWKSVMEKNLEPIKCTIIENRRKHEKKPTIEQTKSLSIEEPQDVDALIKEATDKVHAEYKTLWLAALKEIKEKKLDKLKLVTQARCKLCESMEIPMEEYSTDIDAATAKEEVKALNKWESVSKRAKRGDKKKSKEVDRALRQREKEQVQYRFVNVIEEKKKSGAYKMWRSNLVKPPCRCGKKNCECNTNPAIICMRTPLASRIERRSEPVAIPKPAVDHRRSCAESTTSSRRTSEISEKRSLKKASVHSTPPAVPKVPSPIPAPELQQERSFVDEHTQTQDRQSVKSAPERTVEPPTVDKSYQTDDDLTRPGTSDKSVDATGSKTGRVEEDETGGDVREEESEVSAIGVKLATPFIHDLTKSIISEISSLNLPFADVSTFLKMPSELQLEAVSALVLTRAHGHDLSEMQLRDISQIILDHVLDVEIRSEYNKVEEDEPDPEPFVPAPLPPRQKSLPTPEMPAMDSKVPVAPRMSAQEPITSQLSGPVTSRASATAPIPSPAVPRPIEPRSSVLKPPPAAPAPVQAPTPPPAPAPAPKPIEPVAPRPAPVQPVVKPAIVSPSAPPRSSILADIEELTPRGSAVMERQVSLLLPDGEVEIIQRSSRVEMEDTTWEKPSAPRHRVPPAERKGSVEVLKFKKQQTSKASAGDVHVDGDQIVHVFSTQEQDKPPTPPQIDEDYEPTETKAAEEKNEQKEVPSGEKLLAVVNIEGSAEQLAKPAGKKSTTFLDEEKLDENYEESFNPQRLRDSIFVSKERLEKMKDKDEPDVNEDINLSTIFRTVTLEDSYVVNKRRLDKKARDSIFVTKERLLGKKKGGRKSIDAGLEEFRLKLRQAREKRQSMPEKSEESTKKPEGQKAHTKHSSNVHGDKKNAQLKDSMYINKAHVIKHKLEMGEIDSEEAPETDKQVHLLLPETHKSKRSVDKKRQSGVSDEKSILKHTTKLVTTQDSVFVTKQRVLKHKRDMKESVGDEEQVLRLSKSPRSRTRSGSSTRKVRSRTDERGSFVPPNSPIASEGALGTQSVSKKDRNSSRELRETDYESLAERQPESKLVAIGSGNKEPCDVCLCKKCRCKATGLKIKRAGGKGRKFAPTCPFATRSKKSKKHAVSQFVEFGSEFVSVRLSNVTEKISPMA